MIPGQETKIPCAQRCGQKKKKKKKKELVQVMPIKSNQTPRQGMGEG